MDFISLEHQGDRKEQQDAYFAQGNATGLRLALVADGVGGQIGGRDAAQACKQIAQLWWHEHEQNPPPPRDYLRGLFYNAHVRINEVAKRTGESPRAAVAAVLVQGGRAWLAHSGDCRIYVLRGDQLVHRSPDHSVVQMLLDRGKISEDQMGLHPDKGKLLQCVGGAEFAEPDILEFPLQPGDRILLCSDGLWEHQTRDVIRLAMALGTRRALTELIQDSVRRAAGKSDNIALIYFDAAGTLRGEPIVPLWAVAIVIFIFGVTALGIVAFPIVSNRIAASRKKSEPVVVVIPADQMVLPAAANPPADPAAIEPKPTVAPDKPPGEIPPAPLTTPAQTPPSVPAMKPTQEDPGLPKALPLRRSRGFDQKNGFTNSLGMKFVYAGTHRVYVSVFETSVSAWKAFIAEQPPSNGSPPLPDDRYPISGISADQAEAFCTWLTNKERTQGIIGTEDQGYDLPTDNEWIAAAQPDPKLKFKTGNLVFPWEGELFPPTKNDIANLGILAAASRKPTYTDSYPEAAPVDSFGPHNYGLYNMGGNVAEWTVPTSGDGLPCLRGGGWTDFTAEAFAIMSQTPMAKGAARVDCGFRCVLRIALDQAAATAPAIDLTAPAPGVPASVDPASGKPALRATVVDDPPKTMPSSSLTLGTPVPPSGSLDESPPQIVSLDSVVAATALAYIASINRGPQDLETLTQALAPTVSYNGQAGVRNVDLIAALHHWINSRGGGTARLSKAYSLQQAGDGAKNGIWLDFSVTTREGPTYFFSQQVFIEIPTGKILRLTEIVPTDDLAVRFPAPKLVRPADLSTPLPPVDRRGTPAVPSPPSNSKNKATGSM